MDIIFRYTSIPKNNLNTLKNANFQLVISKGGGANVVGVNDG